MGPVRVNQVSLGKTISNFSLIVQGAMSGLIPLCRGETSLRTTHNGVQSERKTRVNPRRSEEYGKSKILPHLFVCESPLFVRDMIIMLVVSS